MEEKEHKEKETKQDKRENHANYLVIALIGLLLLLSAVQAVQINDLKEESGGQSIAGNVVSSPRPQSNPVRTTAPTMVGGC